MNSAQASVGDAKTEIVVSRENAPLFSPGKTPLPMMGEADFSDASHWDELAGKYLPRYDLPRWDQLPTVEALKLWLYRLDLPERAFLKTGAYRSLQDCIDLNARWPLRGLIGLMLELRHEVRERGER